MGPKILFSRIGTDYSAARFGSSTHHTMAKSMKVGCKPLKKGNATGSSKDKKPLPKGKAARKQTKKKGMLLKSTSLAKLGKMTLAEKMKNIGETASTPEEGAHMLKEAVSKLEGSNMWSQHNTHLKHNAADKEEFDQLSKKDKGIRVAMWMLQKNIPRFMHVSETLEQSATLDKREKWESELEMLKKFTAKELELHISSGRVLWRYDPWTPTCYQYQDQQDTTKTTRVKKARAWTEGQEYEQTEDTAQQWHDLKSRDFNAHMLDIQGWGGKGKSLPKGFGKGKALAKGKGHQKKLAIEDGDPEDPEATEEQEWQTCLNKVKKARDAGNSVLSDLEQATLKCNQAKRLTKSARGEADKLHKEIAQQVSLLKKVLLKKQQAMVLAKVKSLLQDSAQKIKEVKEEVKELNQLANKAASKASKS